MAKLTIEEIEALVKACTYKEGWEILFLDDGERPCIQVAATTPCSVSGEDTPWKSGKTYLSPFMCRQEVVAAVYGAIEKAELHEIREHFRYKGASIFNPHLDPDVLAEVARKKSSFNLRESPMEMVEEEVTVKPCFLDPEFDDFHFTMKDNPSIDYFWSACDGQVEWTYADKPHQYRCSSVNVRNFIKTGQWRVV